MLMVAGAYLDFRLCIGYNSIAALSMCSVVEAKTLLRTDGKGSVAGDK